MASTSSSSSDMSEEIEFLSRGAFADPVRHVFSTSFINFGSDFRCSSRSLRVSESTRCAKGQTLILIGRRGTSEGSRILQTNGKLTRFAQRVESLAQCNLETQRKSIRKSSRNRRKSCLGASALFGRLWSLEAARSSDLERPGASRPARGAGRAGRASWHERNL